MEKKSTQPPPRYSEDKLIKELVNKNIGRPATYADLTQQDYHRNYVEKKGQVFHATDLGKKITDELRQFFTFMDYDYTAKMEQQLDEIESGKVNHVDMLKKFFPEFQKELNKAYLGHGATMCPKCGSPMSVRTTKTGDKFLGCSGYPKCQTHCESGCITVCKRCLIERTSYHSMTTQTEQYLAPENMETQENLSLARLASLEHELTCSN